jgi:RNA polymerase sigma-70 factor, ECF subfamily
VTGESRELNDWLDTSYAKAYRTAVMICGNPDDAREAVQDAFLRAWRFRASLPPDDGREPWLYRVIVNSCYSKLRQEVPRRDRERQRVDPNDSLSITSVADGPEALAEYSQLAGAFAVALDALPETLRVPLVLRYWSGLSEREIALAIRRRPGTVKSRLHEARRRLASDPNLAGFAAELLGAAR